MKYCRWNLVASRRSDFVTEIVYDKSFRTIDEAVKVCTGFTDDVTFVLYDNDLFEERISNILDLNNVSIDISEFVLAQKDFEKHMYCVR